MSSLFSYAQNDIVEHEKQVFKTITEVKQIYGQRLHLTETQFISVTEACNLPHFLNLALFRKMEIVGNMEQLVSFSTFVEGWINIKKNRFDDESLFFHILKKPNCAWISPEDFLLVLEDVVLNHPGLQFLGDNPIFQERYIETVICRIYYEAKCANGRMTLSHFQKSNFVQMIRNLGPDVDLNNTRDCFSYKHFYVLYCKFWVLDEDHDLIISESHLSHYNDGLLSRRLIQKIIQYGRIPAFTREQPSGCLGEKTLTYLDYIWFFLAEIDKSRPVAIEYWFRCMDDDGDGVITTYDLELYWNEQDKRLNETIEFYSEDAIRFQDLICQLNDLVQPQIPGQFRLSDLKKDGIIAERFFDTFLNVEKFQIHDTYQGLIRANQQLEREKKRQYELERKKLLELHQQFLVNQLQQEQVITLEEGDTINNNTTRFEPFSLGSWCDYAEREYDLLILNEQCVSNDSDWSVQDEEDGSEIVSPKSTGSESDSSAPSTPVMQDTDQSPWFKEQRVDKNLVDDWIWHPLDE